MTLLASKGLRKSGWTDTIQQLS